MNFSCRLVFPDVSQRKTVFSTSFSYRLFFPNELTSSVSSEQAAKVRIDLIRLLASAVLQDLKGKGEDAFKDMNDWLGARYLKEMERLKLN